MIGKMLGSKSKGLSSDFVSRGFQNQQLGQKLFLLRVQARENCSSLGCPFLVNLDLPPAKGSVDQQQQPSETERSSTYDLRKTESRRCTERNIPYYKHLNTGAKPKNVDVEEEEILDNNSSKETNEIERDFGSSDGQEVVLVSESSPIDPTTLSSNSPSSEPPSSSSNFKLPEGPPNRSPLPPEWSQNRENSNQRRKTKNIYNGR